MIRSFQLLPGRARTTAATGTTATIIRPVSRMAAARRGGSRRCGALSPSRARTLPSIYACDPALNLYEGIRRTQANGWEKRDAIVGA